MDDHSTALPPTERGSGDHGSRASVRLLTGPTAEDAPIDRGVLLALLAQGLTDEAIGRRLGISARTVRRRVAEIADSLGAKSRFQAGVRAMAAGWLTASSDGDALLARDVS